MGLATRAPARPRDGGSAATTGTVRHCKRLRIASAAAAPSAGEKQAPADRRTRSAGIGVAAPPGHHRPMDATVRIGISGWTYDRWRGTFFPPRLARRGHLRYAAERFGSIEINGTFYGLLAPDAFAKFHDETPDDFVFAVKAPRFITHMLRARDLGAPLANFLASGVLRLGAKLGPMLWQFPERHAYDVAAFARFLAALPRDMDEAAHLARQHDDRPRKGTWTEKRVDGPLRHAVEVRSRSFEVRGFVDLLREHDVGLVVADAVDWPLLFDVTSDFVYCRLHGSEELYVSGYDDAALEVWARRVAAWAEGREPRGGRRVGSPAARRPRDVYVYFDNDAKVRAPVDAARLQQLVARRLGRPKRGASATDEEKPAGAGFEILGADGETRTRTAFATTPSR